MCAKGPQFSDGIVLTLENEPLTCRMEVEPITGSQAEFGPNLCGYNEPALLT